MKFYLATVLVLANGIIAMPWTSKLAKNGGSRAHDDITLHIEVSQKGDHKAVARPAHADICWLACFSQEPTCPEGWYSKNMTDGSCWTCCRNVGGDDDDL